MPEPKVILKPMVMDSLVELVIQDIQMTKRNPIPLPLAHLAEKCLPIYKRFEKVYLKEGIDYSEGSGTKNISDIHDAIIKLRDLEVERMSYENPNKDIGGRVTTWRYPPVDGDATILLTQFTDDVLSLTDIPKTEIKIMLERDIFGIAPAGNESETT